MSVTKYLVVAPALHTLPQAARFGANYLIITLIPILTLNPSEVKEIGLL